MYKKRLKERWWKVQGQKRKEEDQVKSGGIGRHNLMN